MDESGEKPDDPVQHGSVRLVPATYDTSEKGEPLGSAAHTPFYPEATEFRTTIERLMCSSTGGYLQLLRLIYDNTMQNFARLLRQHPELPEVLKSLEGWYPRFERPPLPEELCPPWDREQWSHLPSDARIKYVKLRYLWQRACDLPHELSETEVRQAFQASLDNAKQQLINDWLLCAEVQ